MSATSKEAEFAPCCLHLHEIVFTPKKSISAHKKTAYFPPNGESHRRSFKDVLLRSHWTLLMKKADSHKYIVAVLYCDLFFSIPQKSHLETTLLGAFFQTAKHAPASSYRPEYHRCGFLWLCSSRRWIRVAIPTIFERALADCVAPDAGSRGVSANEIWQGTRFWNKG